METPEKEQPELGDKNEIKEYARIIDYFDAVLEKTYEVLEEVEGNKELFRDKKHRMSVNTAKINYEGSTDFYAKDWPTMTIYTPYAIVETEVADPEESETDKPELNGTLNVTRRMPGELYKVPNLDIYNEVEKALNTGLKDYQVAKVAYK